MTTTSPTGTAPAAAAADLEARVRDLFAATSTAWAAGDADAFASYYADRAAVTVPGSVLAGREAVRTAMAAAFAGPLAGTRRVHHPRGVRPLADDVVLVLTDSVTLAAGESEPAPGRQERGTWVARRHGDRWLIEAYHGSLADQA